MEPETKWLHGEISENLPKADDVQDLLYVLLLNYFKKGVNFYDSARYLEAIEMFDKVLKIYPNQTDALENKDICLKILHLKDQGVTDADMIWWRNLSGEDKEFLKKTHYAGSNAMVQTFLDQGLSTEDAVRKTYKILPEFEDFPLKETLIKGLKAKGYSEEDYPLPWELKDRFVKFTFRCLGEGRQEWLKKTLEGFSTANAFLRAQIREGKV